MKTSLKQRATWKCSAALLVGLLLCQCRLVLSQGAAGTNTVITSNLEVQTTGVEGFSMSAEAIPVDAVSFKVFFSNTSTDVLRKPTITIDLGKRVRYLQGTSYLAIKKNNQNEEVRIADPIINGSKVTWEFSDVSPNPDASFYLVFQASVAEQKMFQSNSTNLHFSALASSGNVSVKTNDVSLNVAKQTTPRFTVSQEVRNLTQNTSRWAYQVPAVASPGDLVQYKLELINRSINPAENVILKMVLPKGLTYAGNAKMYTSDSGDTGQDVQASSLVENGYVLPLLPSGNKGYHYLVFSARVADPYSDIGSLQTGNASVLYKGVQRTQSNSYLLVANQGLQILQRVHIPATEQEGENYTQIGTIQAGQSVAWRILVLNNTAQTVIRPVISLSLPAGMEYVPDSLVLNRHKAITEADLLFAGAPSGYTLANIPPGDRQEVVVYIRMKNGDSVRGAMEGIVTITSASGEQTKSSIKFKSK